MARSKAKFQPEFDYTSIKPTTTIVWLRRDLRLKDNAALYYALRDHKEVLPLFILDTSILDSLDDKCDKRVEFILTTLEGIRKELHEMGSSLLVLHGDPLRIYKQLKPQAVYTNEDYEPYARERDEKVAQLLAKNKVGFKTSKDQVIFSKDEVVKDLTSRGLKPTASDNAAPYTIFTPYSRKWKATIKPFFLKSYPTEKYFGNLLKTKPFPFPTLSDIGFETTNAAFPERVVHQSIIANYDKTRNFPALHGTTRLSMHLRFGTVSIRMLARLAQKKNQTWLNELIWRDFYHMILWHFPKVQTQSFKPAYDQIVWRNNEKEFAAWCLGKTGYPIVDAGMRELNTTGFIHNRVRMITASFLTKHLLIDWRWGEAYFAKKLLDYDLAANNGGWQWAAGSGCDAAPYFRVFNPQLQTEKFDPDLKYIRHWVKEYGTPDYPEPIVEHAFARERVLKVFKQALNS